MDFPEKRASTEVKYLLSMRPILRNFTEGNERKFDVIFAFCAYADVIKYPKVLTFSFERAQILSFHPQRANDHKTIKFIKTHKKTLKNYIS